MDAGTNRMETEVTPNKERDDEIDKLIKIITLIVNEMGEQKTSIINDLMAKAIYDLDISDELSGFLMTVFTCLRKQENDDAGHQRFLGYVAKVDGVEISVKTIVENIKKDGIKLNFLVATPIVELLTLFRAFFDEVRTGVTRFKVRESVAKKGLKRDKSGKVLPSSKGEDRTQSMTQYGLCNQHICLMQGITLAPERRTGIIRSLGPMTQAILMVMEDKFFDKIRSAMQHSLQMLPMANEIITCLREASHPGSVSGVLKELADILLLTTARSTQKIYFPLLLFFDMWKNRGSAQISFSGVEMLKFYTDFCVKRNVTFVIRTGGDMVKTSEVVFHSMFGTYLDNLDILPQITNRQKWHTRKELNTIFQQRSKKGNIVFPPVLFTHVSKMAQALLTKSLGNIEPMAIGRPSFTGFRKRHFTQEFLSYITTGKSALNFTSDPTQLQYALKKLKDELLGEREKLGFAGTNKWLSLSKDGTWVDTDFIPVEGSLFFYG